MSRIRDRSRSAWQYLVSNPLRVLEALLLVSCFGVAIWSEFASDKPDWAFWCTMGLGLVWYVLWLRRWLPGQDFTKQSWSDRFEEGKTAASNDRLWFAALILPLFSPVFVLHGFLSSERVDAWGVVAVLLLSALILGTAVKTLDARITSRRR